MRVPKYRHQKLRNLGFVEHGGRRIYFPGDYGSATSRDAYRDFLNSITAPIPEQFSTALKTVAEVVLAYLNHAKQYYGDKTRGEYVNMKCALMPLVATEGHTRIAAFGPMRLKKYQQQLVSEGKKRPYINACTAKIKRVFKWAASEELIPVSVYHGLTTVAGLMRGRTSAMESESKQPVAWCHVKAIFPELSPVILAMVQMQWLTGARSDSICHATPAQFDRSLALWLWRPKHKNEYRGKELVIPIGPKCQEIIKEFFDGKPDEPLFSPRAARKHWRYRSRYDTGSYRQAIHRAIERTNKNRDVDSQIPLWSPHQLRHSKGHEVREKFGIEAAQAILGHESLEATEIYSARRLELAKQVARETG